MKLKNKKETKTKKISFVLRVIRYIKRNFFDISKTIIFELDLENPGLKNAADLNLFFRLATKEDVVAMDKENYDCDKKAKKYLINQLEKGDRCILVLYENKIIAYFWVMNEFMELTQFKHIFLSKNRAYSYKEFVLKEFRGKRVHSAMYSYLIDMLKKEGKHFVVSTVDADNKSSLKTRSKGRFKVIGNIIRIRFFGLRYDYLKKEHLFYLQNQ